MSPNSKLGHSPNEGGVVEVKVIDANLLHPSKTPPKKSGSPKAINCKVEGNVIVVNEEQFKKAPALIFVNPTFKIA